MQQKTENNLRSDRVQPDIQSMHAVYTGETIQMALKLPEDLRQEVRRIGEATGLPEQALIRAAIRSMVARYHEDGYIRIEGPAIQNEPVTS